MPFKLPIFNKRLPIILQTEVAECGLASMAMIANYHGHDVDLNALRRLFSISSKGATLAGLIKLAGSLQLRSTAVRIEMQDLINVQVPAILHWDLNHFVVLKSVRANKISIHDPAFGLIVFSFDEFAKHFTGIVLELTPTTDFRARKLNQKMHLSDLWGKISGIKSVLIQIFILSMILQVFAIVSPFYMQLVIDDVIISGDGNLLLVLALGFGLLSFIGLFVAGLRRVIILFMGSQLSIQIAADLFAHLLSLPLSFFNKRHMGDIVSRFGSLENIKQLLTTGLIEASVDGIMAIGLFVMIFIYSPVLALIVMFTIAIYVFIRLALYNRFRNSNEEMIVMRAKQQTNFMETIRGLQSIKLFGNETQRQSVWLNHYCNTINSGIKVRRLYIQYNMINTLLFGLENIFVIYLATRQIMDNRMTVGMLFAFMSYKGLLTIRASTLVDRLIQFKMLSLHLNRLADIVLSTKEKYLNPQQQFKLNNGLNLSLQNVSFRYADGEPYIIKGLNLAIKKGQSVAIVGASGCGKSTLMKIMLGLLQPEAGVVKVNSQNLNFIGLNVYRTVVATVMQDDHLLSGSIADNICFFQVEFDFDQIVKSAKMAAIHSEIMAMPMGYQSLVGDMGSSLSGGQKQRLLIARALYKKPDMLFLDEATSSLDIKLESQVNATIKKLNITRIIIAHRPKTIAMADVVFTLKGN